MNANHETNALAVANEQVDVATNNTESLYARLAKAQPEDAAKIKEIWRSPLIPSDPMVWRANLPAEVKQDLLYFFMTYGRFGAPKELEREREVLADMGDGWGPFLMSSNPQLIPIRQLELFRNKPSCRTTRRWPKARSSRRSPRSTSSSTRWPRSPASWSPRPSRAARVQGAPLHPSRGIAMTTNPANGVSHACSSRRAFPRNDGSPSCSHGLSCWRSWPGPGTGPTCAPTT